MKKRLIKYTALALLTMLPSMLYAQLNPKQGYVITNKNDTIYGTIDYLSDTKCANECHFQANGETEYKVYLPGEISAYRFADNGVFYITKTFEVEGKPETFFAEYLLQGGISLFHHKRAGIDYYYFIDEEGKVASIKKDTPREDAAYIANSERNANKRAALREVSQMFANSEKALHDFWVKDFTTKNLTQITHDYDMEYCTSAGDCVVFRHNEKATRSLKAKLRFQAGVGIGTTTLTPIEYAYALDYLTLKSTVPQLGVGLDFLFPRSTKHLSAQVLFLISKWSMSKEYNEYKIERLKKTAELKFIDLEVQLGAAYSFLPDSKFSPILCGGMAIDNPTSISRENLRTYWFAGDNFDEPSYYNVGFYIGAGVDIVIKKHVLRINAEYKKLSNTDVRVNSCFSINAGIRL